MAHMIEKNDKGYVGMVEKFGGTWHRLPQYIQVDGPVSPLQAIEVLNYDLEKRENFGMSNDGAMRIIPDSFHIVRPDTDDILVPCVGNRFEVFNNADLFRYVQEFVLAKYPDLLIESVGTLGNGSTSFVNLMVKAFYIKGDNSPHLSRLMYYNPLGMGSYGVGVHSIRIVCNNTLTAAKAQASANNSMLKFRHTFGAQEKINNAVADLANTFLHLEEYQENLQYLTTFDMDTKSVSDFLESMFPSTKGSKKSETANKNKQKTVLNVFETVQDGMDKSISRTAYAMLNALTYVVDHPEKLRKGQDVASNTWDGLVGLKADFKAKALNNLLAIAV